MGSIFKLGNRIRSIPAENRFRRVDLSKYQRVSSGMIDLPRENLISRALEFKYIDRETKLPSQDVTRDDNYEIRLLAFWGLDYLSMELDVDSWTGNNHGTISGSKPLMTALIIDCKDSLLESEETIAAWDGYKEENNFWPLFSPQFDDSLMKVQGLYVSPFGCFEIKFENLLRLHKRTLMTAAVLFGIVNNIKYIYFRDQRDPFDFTKFNF